MGFVRLGVKGGVVDRGGGKGKEFVVEWVSSMYRDNEWSK